MQNYSVSTKWHRRQKESSKYVLKDCSSLSTSTCISRGHVQRQLAWLKEIEEEEWNDSGETIISRKVGP